MKKRRTELQAPVQVRPRMTRTPSEPSSINQQQLSQALARDRMLVDARLDRLIPQESSAPEIVHAAIRWSLFAGGKRLRPLLLLATGQELGAEVDLLLD